MRSAASVSILGLVVACGSVVSAPVGAARGQQMTVAVASSDRVGGEGGGRISKSGVETYASLVGLSDDQKAMVKELHAGYEAAYQEAAKQMRDAIQEAQRKFEETQDHSVWMETIPKARRAQAERTAQLEETFFADFRSLLSEEQGAAWPRVERQRRRETVLTQGGLSGESVNLLQIVEALKLNDSARAALAEPLGSYESDLDRVLTAKQQTLKEMGSFEGGGPIDVEAMQERMAKAREAGMKIREVNERHARVIESLLPEDQRPGFEAAVQRATFPRVYRPSRVSGLFDEAGKFGDLTEEQRSTLASLRSAYERELAAVNAKWASAIADSEKSGDSNSMVLPGGGVMSLSFGGEDQDSPLAQARKARQELDAKMRERLEASLTPQQREKLPKPPPQQLEEGMFVMTGPSDFHGDLVEIEAEGDGGGEQRQVIIRRGGGG